ncbi:4-hydroxy-tetrahydrodipicolinate reductase [Clostridium cellulovorans]|uniref:4-hydroxy-tetrahydrodipicolinate reductase n=1 Tax=Clostridium cellulovorans (strain ATCC 35296 / DSM 3052 / OCM 3 / 743B) TaxID=573061 RepID=D9SLZ3_CLOC7|nr:4-hydroxy-tetrahydrodipicolinate reductase [Clostridium cellulovorans]ADL51724.1 dihydrodipicolinate reductase [Clostridium cellulovorans 743B]
MTNILLIGCLGKMGKMVTEIANQSNYAKIVAGVDRLPSTDGSFPVFKSLKDCNVPFDVIIDFSRPDALDDLLSYSKENLKPVILCTTGYTKEQVDLISEASKVAPIFRSGNMSVGINVINNILKNISSFLYGDYDIEIIEKHHNQKVDAPSGTALLLGDTIREAIKSETEYCFGREGNHKREQKEIGVHAIRGGTIIGEHEVIFAGNNEVIELKHTALSREVFASGAIRAAAYMKTKTVGLFNMDDVINNR